MRRPVRIGDILLIRLPQQVPPGVEQMGTRPAVVVGIPDKLGAQRFPIWLMVPFTSRIGAWARATPGLYPIYLAGTAGLTLDSVALTDHVRGVDLKRIIKPLGSLTAEQYAPIKAALATMTELEMTDRKGE